MTAPVRPVAAATMHRRVPGTTSSRPGDRAASALAHAPGRTSRLLDRARRGPARELIVFASIGVVSTAAYAVLYLAFRPFAGAVAANAAALVITAVANTAANRRLTFGVRATDRATVLRDQLAGLVALGVALAITSASVTLLGVIAPAAGRPVELAVLVAANAAATVSRFLLLRAVVTRPSGRLEPSAVTTSDRSRP